MFIVPQSNENQLANLLDQTQQIVWISEGIQDPEQRYESSPRVSRTTNWLPKHNCVS